MWLNGWHAEVIRNSSPEMMKAREIETKARLTRDAEDFQALHDVKILVYRESMTWFIIHKILYCLLSAATPALLILANISFDRAGCSRIMNCMLVVLLIFFMLYLLFFVSHMGTGRKMSDFGFRSGVKRYHLYTLIFSCVLTFAAVLAALGPLISSPAGDVFTGSPTDRYTDAVKAAIIYQFFAAVCMWIIFVMEGFRKIDRVETVDL